MSLYGISEFSDFVIDTKKISIPCYENVFNPSIIQTDQGLLLSFRYCPYDRALPLFSEIGLVYIDKNFNPISQPILLNMREGSPAKPHKCEDARLFEFDKKYFIIFNDSQDANLRKKDLRRDINLVELFCNSNRTFDVSKPLELRHYEDYETTCWQKNWYPIPTEDALYLGYTISPHELIDVNFETGICKTEVKQNFDSSHWRYGQLRGGTPALPTTEGYLTFFHSSIGISTPNSLFNKFYCYFMGAMILDKSPPHAIKKISVKPINHPSFYDLHKKERKKVIFPGGFIFQGNDIFLVYGKDDREIWVAKLDKEGLLNSLIDVNLPEAPTDEFENDL